MKKLLIISCWVVLLVGVGCQTEPIIPPGHVVTNPPVPPVQDPGTENLCAEGEISFQHEVLPILVSSCAYSGCHDAHTAEEGVVLDTYEHIMRDVKPGDPNDSELYESITESDDDIMPPPPAPRMTSQQIAIIREWIVQGANETDCGTPCDPTQASFTADIFPLLQSHCVGCHNSSRTDGNVNLKDYANILTSVENGALLGSIKHEEFYIAMPPSGSQLSACRIAQVEQWIADGAPNN